MSVYVIAEVGSVHDGSLGNALKLIDLAKSVGADAVKFQMHDAENETLPDAPVPDFFSNEGRFEYFKRTAFSLEQWQAVSEHCSNSGIDFVCSPFSSEAVTFLLEVGVSSIKIASGEVTNADLLERVRCANKPTLLSTGMSTWSEIDDAVRRLHSVRQLTILQCTSLYPTPFDSVGLNVLSEMRQRYGFPVGISDHTPTAHTVIAAVALGAEVIEKHITFSRRMYGSDAFNALEPEEFAWMVEGIRHVSEALNHPLDKSRLSTEILKAKEVFEKRLVAREDLGEGEILQRQSLVFRKADHGIPVSRLEDVLGARLVRKVFANRPVSYVDLMGFET